MKRIFLLVVFLIAGVWTFAQSGQTETVYLSNGSVIKGVVMEQTKDQVKIKTSDGSVFVYETSQVERIVKNQVESSENKLQESASSQRPFIKGVRFNGYFEMKLICGGGSSGSPSSSYYGHDMFGQNPSFSLGARIFDYGYVGFKSGVEIQEMFYKGDFDGFLWMIPFMLDTRGYFPINETIHPYVEFALGTALLFGEGADHNADTALKFNLGTGVDIRRLSLGFGWNATGKLNQCYFKIGVKIGKRS